MFEKLLRMYLAYMHYDVRSPLPHLIGPPGVGKSTSIEKLAEILGVRLHILNVSRVSPLELEGVQMPHGTGEDMVLRLLHAPFWKDLKEGDIVHLEEFLRGFPEVYNGLLDILTSREVAGYKLPQVFIVGSSNTHITYDPALEDRLLHIPVADPRTNNAAYKELVQLLINEIGLMPVADRWNTMAEVMDRVVCPAYAVLDSLNPDAALTPVAASENTKSLRNLIGQVKYREIVTPELNVLIETNNREALASGMIEYVILTDETDPNLPAYAVALEQYKAFPEDLGQVHLDHIEMNKKLIQLAQAKASLNAEESTEREEEEICES